METLVGEIDSKYGIVIDRHPEGYLTYFILNVGEKKYVIFFKDKIVIPCSKTVVTGQISTQTEFRALLEKTDSRSTATRLILDTLKNIRTREYPDLDGIRFSLPEHPYMVAEKVRDCTNNILYST